MIRVENLSKAFGALKVLERVNLKVEEGEKVAVIGPSGCGKSVLLRLIELLERPDSGRIYVDGEEITGRGADVNRIRRKMGMVYQTFNLFSHLDVMDNLCLAPTRLKRISRAAAEAQAMQLLKQVSLEKKAHALPAHLSGGQKQRIAIARCLAMQPRVMLFDEPTSALDPTMVGEVLATIRALAREGMTMLIVTHEMTFARSVADRVLYLDEYGIYEEGTPEQIFESPRRDKTRAFIRKLKYFTAHIHRRDFDLMWLHGGIDSFCQKYGIAGKISNRLQLCAEELIYELLANCCETVVCIDFAIEYGELSGGLLIDCACTGRLYNPFEVHDSEPPLGVTILKKLAKNIEFAYAKGRNHFTLAL